MDTEVKQGKLMAWTLRHRVTLGTTLGLTVTLIVAAFGAWQSWGHITHDGRMVGEPTAAYTAISIDGAMFVGGVMGAVDRYRGYKTRWWAIVALWLGSVESIGANIGSAWDRGFWAALWSVIPALQLLVCVEVMFHPSRRVVDAVKSLAEKDVEALPPPAPTVAPDDFVVWQPLFPDAPEQEAHQPEPPIEPEAPQPRKRAPRKPRATGPGSRPRKKVDPEPELDNVTHLRPSVDDVLPALNGRKPSLALVPSWDRADFE